MSRFENLSRQPTVELIIGAEIIFGQTAKDVFPALYHDIETDHRGSGSGTARQSRNPKTIRLHAKSVAF